MIQSFPKVDICLKKESISYLKTLYLSGIFVLWVFSASLEDLVVGFVFFGQVRLHGLHLLFLGGSAGLLGTLQEFSVLLLQLGQIRQVWGQAGHSGLQGWTHALHHIRHGRCRSGGRSNAAAVHLIFGNLPISRVLVSTLCSKKCDFLKDFWAWHPFLNVFIEVKILNIWQYLSSEAINKLA